jgi:hypothetical protein
MTSRYEPSWAPSAVAYSTVYESISRLPTEGAFHEIERLEDVRASTTNELGGRLGVATKPTVLAVYPAHETGATVKD